MLKLKLQYFDPLIWRSDSFEKTMMLGKIGGRRRRGRQWMRWLDVSPTQWTWVWLNSGSWWWTGRPGVLQSTGSQRIGHEWATELNWLTVHGVLKANVPLVSNFLEEISSLPHSIVFLYFLHWPLRKAFLSVLLFFITLHSGGYIFPFLLCFWLLFSSICNVSSSNYFAFLRFFFLEMVLITISCTMLWTSIHCSSGTLSDLIPSIYLSLPLYTYKGFDLGHTWMI